MTQTKWLLCPVCGGKTRTKLRPDTEAKNLIVFCPKCKREILADIDGEKGECKMYTDLMDAYGIFKKKKNLKNLINLYNNAFVHKGVTVWKLFRFAKNLITGRYEKLYKRY